MQGLSKPENSKKVVQERSKVPKRVRFADMAAEIRPSKDLADDSASDSSNNSFTDPPLPISDHPLRFSRKLQGSYDRDDKSPAGCSLAEYEASDSDDSAIDVDDFNVKHVEQGKSLEPEDPPSLKEVALELMKGKDDNKTQGETNKFSNQRARSPLGGSYRRPNGTCNDPKPQKPLSKTRCMSKGTETITKNKTS